MKHNEESKEEVELLDTLEWKDEQKILREEVDIHIPANYKEIIEETLNDYKKWYKENTDFLIAADEAETEEAHEEFIKKSTEHFKKRYSGVLAKDQGERLSVSQIKRIWDRFIREQYRDFLRAHTNLKMKQILEIGIDKFVYVMGWRKSSDAGSWRDNRLRIGVCCHCKDQFIPMMIQYNHGLCSNCRPEYSSEAIRKFVLKQFIASDRYKDAQRDLLMDFYIMFYHDDNFRKFFLKGSSDAELIEALEVDEPVVENNETSGV